jgi:hypothetical protein
VRPLQKLKPLLFLLGLFACLIVTRRVDASSTSSGTLIQSLDGEWQSAPDLNNGGETAKWFDPASFPASAARPLQVPGAVTEVWPISTFTDPSKNAIWYLKTFPLLAGQGANMRYYLRFGAVMTMSDVWLNGIHLGAHEGGEDPFEFDVTSLLQPGKPNAVAVRLKLWPITPVPEGGITQDVSLVAQPEVRILDAFAKPDAKAGQIHLEVTIENNTKSPAQVGVKAALGEYKTSRSLGSQLATITAPPGQTVAKLDLPVKRPHLWDLNDPFLYTVKVTSNWNAGDGATRDDIYSFRTGFRDFRMVDGYFHLNGRRIFLKCTHSNWYDPVTIHATSRDTTWTNRDVPQLKKAGFNAFRFIISAAMPQQLDRADELGFLIYSEHETSWLLKDPTKFGITLDPIVRRDRNHPSLVLWGLLNETDNQDTYQRAKAWLPSLRAIDDTRPVILSSGRWDKDLTTASISNAGSTTWDVYLGGQDPQNPKPTGPLRDELGAYKDGTGDAHIYPFYPLTWNFITDFGKLDQDNPHPFFLSESGIGSSYNAFGEKRELEKAHAPQICLSWSWVNAGIDGMTKAWSMYGMSETYPRIEDMLVDSALEAARQRELIFSLVRGNPKINGYNLTSFSDAWGSSEGVMDNFREFKPGHLKVLQEGWAPLRWCLLVNPTNVYADQPMHVKVSLANEDALPGGDYPATLDISGPSGVVWKQAVIAHIQQDGPFAYSLFDEDIHVPDLKEGAYVLEASLKDKPNAAASKLPFTVTSHTSLPAISGAVTVAGVGQNVRDLLAKQGAQLHDYAPKEEIDREIILVGPDFKGNAADWRALYAHAARGAHLVFLSGTLFHTDTVRNKWLALPAKGDQDPGYDWLYHKDVIGKVHHPLLAGLPTKLMCPEYYEGLLYDTHWFYGMTLPADTAAIGIYRSFAASYHSFDGVMLGTYPFHAGHFTINAFNIVGSMGSPATDRLLLNLVIQAQADAAPLASLPSGYDAEMDKFGFTDPTQIPATPAK